MQSNLICDPPHCSFSKNAFFRETMNPWFFVTFNIIISHIFSENFIVIRQVVQNRSYEDFLLRY